MKPFTRLSMFSMIFITLGWLTALYYQIEGLTQDGIGNPVELVSRSDNYEHVAGLINLAVFYKMPQFFGYSMFSIESLGSILPIRNGMEKKKHFRSIFISTVIGIATFNIIFGIIG